MVYTIENIANLRIAIKGVFDNKRHLEEETRKLRVLFGKGVAGCAEIDVPRSIILVALKLCL